MPKVKVNDFQMYYEVRGEGFPLVMIHGLGANADWWDPYFIRGLSEKFKTLAFDNRGAGRTDVTEERYSIDLFARDTVRLMEGLGIRKSHVFGVSMGGMIAQELVLNYPERVERLVLCGTYCGGEKAVYPPRETFRSIADLGDLPGILSDRATAKRALKLFFTEEFLEGNPEAAEAIRERMIRAPISREAFMRQLEAVMGFDTYERLSRIKAETLVLHGKKDIIVPPENALILAKAIPKARLYVGNSGHWLAEERERVLRIVLDFLESRPA